MGKKNEKKISYTEAMTEIESILSSLRGENIDIDTLAAKVARASELIELCRKRLHATEEEIKQLFEQ
ncbi:MAG: exodeoxyribonuclease VII small subunit [Alistipes sp.]|nr:exodeoxyribonuclease VII small subunit [Alistipes sp.]